MEKDRLEAYVDNELKTAKQLVTRITTAEDGPKTNLRLLYGIPLKSKTIYAESGGLSNVDCFPADTTIIIPIFPWSEHDLRATIGPLTKLRALIEAGRVFPIVQHPHYYTDCGHLEFLFDRNTPSYFIRGLFVYSAILGIPSEVERTAAGIPVLTAVNRLMTHCDNVHRSWIQYANGDETCWEYRYRNQSIRDDRFYKRLHSSLCYRYASVAICIGQHNADQIISVFSPFQASSVQRGLRIFGHVDN